MGQEIKNLEKVVKSFSKPGGVSRGERACV